MFDLLHRSSLMPCNRMIDIISLSSNMHKSILLSMRFNHQLMRIAVEMNVRRIHHDIIGVAEELGHFLQRDALGFGEDECKNQGSEAADDNENLIEVSGDSCYG